eukprot:4535609-Prymnesium_polylepis.1
MLNGFVGLQLKSRSLPVTRFPKAFGLTDSHPYVQNQTKPRAIPNAETHRQPPNQLRTSTQWK